MFVCHTIALHLNLHSTQSEESQNDGVKELKLQT